MDMTSSSNAIFRPQNKYDVFLSFRGEDTRDNFTSHLHKALLGKKIETYIDYRLERGDDISPGLMKAIEQSKLSVIIFSKNFASSTWCLNELAHILQSKKKYEHSIIPIFYNIDPSHVRKQEGSYVAAFAQLEERFKEKDKDMVRKWKDALEKAANLSGFDSNKIRPESELVETVVKDILKKLNRKSSCDLKGLVGIEKHLEKVNSLLCIDSLDVRTLGIWGMGGIGKTTIADAVYHNLSSEFDACCFFSNVREKSKNRGLIDLRNELLHALLNEENINIATPSLGSPFIKDRLRRTKALIVLDDVNTSSQLEYLADLAKQLLGTGSRTIITTRDRRLLNKRVDDGYIYEVTGLKFDEALELFHLNAFGNNFPTEEYTELSKMVVDYAKGIPLALKVLGSSFGKCDNKEEWKSKLNKLEIFPNPEIQELLRISYQGLDKEEKKIFLHIACLYKGETIEYAKRMLDLCGFFAVAGIRTLIDMSLISITYNQLGMHDLVQQMGWEIVREQGEENPGQRSILWSPEDVYHVLKNKTGSESVEAIFLNMSEIEEIDFNRKAFKGMYNLRLLKFYSPDNGPFTKKQYCQVYLPDQGLQSLPDALRYIHWERCPLKSFPSKFSPHHLVELIMPDSQVERLWNKGQNIRNLKKIVLSRSTNLIEVPDLSRCQNMEEIDLSYCTSLVEIPSYLEYLEKLRILFLGGCSNLKHLPEIPTRCEYLTLYNTAIEELPSSVGLDEKPYTVFLTSCKELEYLSSSTLDLNGCLSLGKVSELPRQITTLNLSEMSRVSEVPRKNTSLNFSEMSRVSEVPRQIPSLNLSEMSRVSELPRKTTTLNLPQTGIMEYCLAGRVSFDLKHTRRLVSLPSNICKLQCLGQIYLLECLKYLKLSGLENLIRLSSTIGNLVALQELHLRVCENLESVPNNIYKLNSLKFLTFEGCSRLKKLPPFSVGLCSLEELNLGDCNNITLEIPDGLISLSSLKRLNLSGSKIESLPTSIKQASGLKYLNLSNCISLRSLQLQELPLLLERLDAHGCTSLETVYGSITQGWDQHGVRGHQEQLIFSNCLQLDQNALSNILIVEAQLKIMRMAIAPLEENYQYKDAPSVSICCPGNEIPQWFSFQSEGSSISTKLPPHWFDTNFLGFALCAVIRFHNYNPCGYGLEFECKSHFKTNDGESLELKSRLYGLGDSAGKNQNRIVNYDHVLVWYDRALHPDEFKGEQTFSERNLRGEQTFPKRLRGENGEKMPTTFNSVTEASFNLYPINSLGQLVSNRNVYIKECGMCLLYGQDD